MSFDVNAMINALGVSARYITSTLFMAGVSMIIGMLLGILVALIRFFKLPGITPLLRGIITILKGIPVVLVMLGTYMLMNQGFNPMAKALGWSIRNRDISPYWIAIFTLVLMAVVNLSEIYRGAFTAIRPGQLDAAKAIGMTRLQIIRRILMPQSLLTVVPMLSNFFINLIKASALASMVGVMDIFQGAANAAQASYSYLEAYVAAAIIYWAISLVVELLSKLFETHLNHKFFATA